MTVPPAGGPPPPLADPSVTQWAHQAPQPVASLNLSGEQPTRTLLIETNSIERTPTGTRATGLPAVIESAGPYIVSIAALVVAAILHDIHAVELIAGGVVGGGVGYGVARGRRS